MKINLWYSKEYVSSGVGHLCEEWKEWHVTKTGDCNILVRQPMTLRDAMNDVANTVEYMLECANKKDK